MDWWSLSDAELESQCDRDHYRASGPGGQHRNKTDSAVRLRHRPTGLLVTATERRSQAENRRQAIQRLREALAFEFRSPIVETAGRIPAELTSTRVDGSWPVSTRNPRFLPIAAYALDMVEHCKGQVSEAGKQLGLGTAQLVKLLRAHPAAWQAAQRIRTSHGLSALR